MPDQSCGACVRKAPACLRLIGAPPPLAVLFYENLMAAVADGFFRAMPDLTCGACVGKAPAPD